MGPNLCGAEMFHELASWKLKTGDYFFLTLGVEGRYVVRATSKATIVKARNSLKRDGWRTGPFYQKTEADAEEIDLTRNTPGQKKEPGCPANG